MKKRRLPKIFFGWRSVFGGGSLLLWIAGFTTYGLSALFKPIASELGFSRVAVSVAASVTRLEGVLEAPITGWAIDRFGPR